MSSAPRAAGRANGPSIGGKPAAGIAEGQPRSNPRFSSYQSLQYLSYANAFVVAFATCEVAIAMTGAPRYQNNRNIFEKGY